MPRPIRDFRIDWKPAWKGPVRDCKLMEFLGKDQGQQVVSDFFAILKKHDGSLFKSSFVHATKRLSERMTCYYQKSYLKNMPELKKAYHMMNKQVLDCLNQTVPIKECIEIIAVGIFWILHEQEAEV